MTNRKCLLIAGGDLRQITAAQRLSEAYTVCITGLDHCGAVPAGVTAVQFDALPESPDALLLPMPVSQGGELLYAPYAGQDIPLDILLKAVKPDGAVLGGRVSEAVRSKAEAAGLHITDYAKDEAFAVRNAVPTAEAALQIAMQEMQSVLLGMPVLILGAGRISRALQPRLRALGAEVTVAARRCSDRARPEGDKEKPPAVPAPFPYGRGLQSFPRIYHLRCYSQLLPSDFSQHFLL